MVGNENPVSGGVWPESVAVGVGEYVGVPVCVGDGDGDWDIDGVRVAEGVAVPSTCVPLFRMSKTCVTAICLL